jgi:S-adenosylmethionine hydrolase
MKGVIVGINPRVQIVDLCHGVSPQDVLEAAFLLECSYRYFPKGTIHVVVVDPGVGGLRKGVVAEGRHGYYVAPDNGVLSYLLASGEIRRVVKITADAYLLTPVSRTFHGRDVFAPVAGHLSRRSGIDRFGQATKHAVCLRLPVPTRKGVQLLVGSVLHVDRFGNLITNISGREISALPLERGIAISIKGRTLHGVQQSYDRLKPGAMGAILGSAGYLEIFANQRSAARLLKAGRGTAVRVEARARR